MEQSWETIGIVFAILMVVGGFYLLPKKSKGSSITKVDELPIEPDSQQPVVPRAVREIRSTADTEQSTVNTTEAVSSHQKVAPQVAPETQAQPSTIQASTAEETAQGATALNNTATHVELDAIQKELEEEQALLAEAEKVLAEQPEEQPSTTLKENEAIIFTKAEMQPLKFEENVVLEEATVLDAHLSEQDRVDEESALATAQKIVALYVYPNPERALSGERTLKMLLKYGLRYGEMSCFHRYEHPEHPSSLMFSVLRIDDDGAPTGFDLEALPTDEVKGLAFFLALPSPQAVQGFDMMASIAGLIARDTEGLVFDEQSLELTQQLRDHWRYFVIEYNPEQAQHLD